MRKKDNQSSISIAYITDHNYVMPTCISIISLLQNKRADSLVKVYVIGMGLEESAIEMFNNLSDDNFVVETIEITEKECKDLYDIAEQNKYIKSHVTTAALIKFNLARLLPNEERILYLDGDVVAQKNYEDIFTFDFEDTYICAVDDWLDYKYDGKSSFCCRISLNHARYFNSGVMFLNLDLIRREHICDALIEYRKTGKNVFMDQDAFNAVLGKKRKVLPYKYNFMSTCVDYFNTDQIATFLEINGIVEVQECLKEAVFVHFTGRYKPWDYQIELFSELFMKYYKESPYKIHHRMLKQLPQMEESEKRIYKEYIFPYDKIEKNEDIILYGAGNIGSLYYEQIQKSKYCNIVHWVDKAHGDKGSEVESLEVLKTAGNLRILVAVVAPNIVEQIMDELKSLYHIDEKNIVYILK